LDKVRKIGLIDIKFSINSHKNRLKMNSERIQQLSQILDANTIKYAMRIQLNINYQKEQLM
jgi:hypothetical protein